MDFPLPLPAFDRGPDRAGDFSRVRNKFPRERLAHGLLCRDAAEQLRAAAPEGDIARESENDDDLVATVQKTRLLAHMALGADRDGLVADRAADARAIAVEVQWKGVDDDMLGRAVPAADAGLESASGSRGLDDRLQELSEIDRIHKEVVHRLADEFPFLIAEEIPAGAVGLQQNALGGNFPKDDGKQVPVGIRRVPENTGPRAVAIHLACGPGTVERGIRRSCEGLSWDRRRH